MSDEKITLDLEAFLNRLESNVNKNMAAFAQFEAAAAQSGYVCPAAISKKMEDVARIFCAYRASLAAFGKPAAPSTGQFMLSFADINDTKALLPGEHKKTFKLALARQVAEHRAPPCAPPLPARSTVRALDGAELQGNLLKLPIIDDLKNLPEAFYWFEGDEHHKKGVYVRLCAGFTARVPFPSVLHGSSKECRANSIRCKHVTRQECSLNKQRVMAAYKFEPKQCSFVHKGERFNKIGSQFRCAVESFGNHETLAADLKRLSHFDIKHLLMCSLSDDLLTVLWYQNMFRNGDLSVSNLDTY